MTGSDDSTDDQSLAYDTRPRLLLVADGESGGAAAIEAADLAGARVVDRIDWATIADGIDRHVAPDLLMAEAAGVAPDLLADALPRLATMARGADARIVVALAPPQIDAVAVSMLGGEVQLLCDPDIGERAAALALAGAIGPATRLNDRATEAESARLRRLDEEVARIAETLARLTRRHVATAEPARPAGFVGDRRPAYAPPPADLAPPATAHDIRKAIRARRLRDQHFDRSLLEDPGWDMLLDLFAAELEGREVSVSSLCIAAAVAPTTALRWIGKMTDAGLFDRRPDPFDRRRAFMGLTNAAREGMQRYCAAAKQLGLAIA